MFFVFQICKFAYLYHTNKHLKHHSIAKKHQVCLYYMLIAGLLELAVMKYIKMTVICIVEGNLVLLNESKLPIWSTNVTSTTSFNSAVAVILDDGNLVLRNGYGMMLFELVTGKRNIDQSNESTFTFFPSMAANVVMAGADILSLLDNRLNREASVEQVTRICKVAYWCIQDEVDSRPSMSQVEQILEGSLDVKMPPVPQSLQFCADNNEHLVFVEPSSTGSSLVLNSSSSGYFQPKSASS
ncbi:hypothetical protein QVD17_18172 [Tagetes erecta]|uniref:Bulb-type lectin domain-containing protein n=1 Tax=Tagetes erecta TaxID=13708 RepID=A0AAD8NVK1_TARER|nr:hypothetical protein QVD17_18172 [Tagetes erecta]